MGKLMLALKIIKILPSLISFVTEAVKALQDGNLTAEEMAVLTEKGSEVLAVIT